MIFKVFNNLVKRLSHRSKIHMVSLPYNEKTINNRTMFIRT